MTTPEETTCTRLLDAAEELFAERGYDAVGIREIADRAGVNLSGIKYHFGSKRGLYLETIRRSMDRRGSTAAWALLGEPIAGRSEAAAALGAFVRAFLRVLLAPDEEGSCACLVMQSALVSGDATDLVVREFIRPHHERLCHLVGILCADATDRERSRYAQAVMAQVLHQRMFREFIERLEPEGAARSLDTLAEEITAFSLRGMGCEDLLSAAGRTAAVKTGERA